MLENPNLRGLPKPSRLKSSDMYNALHPSFFNTDRPATKESSSGWNHTKLLLVDDMVMFGSSNFNSSHIAGNNADIEIATQNTGIVGQLERWYREDLQDSVRHLS